MADADPPFFRSQQPPLRHLEVPFSPLRLDSAPGQRGFPNLRQIDRSAHGSALLGQIQSIAAELDVESAERNARSLPAEVNLVLEVETEPSFELSANDLYSLTAGTETQVLFAHPEQTADGRKFTRALLHVPFGQLSVLAEKCRRDTEDQTDGGNVPNPWVANLQRIARAAFKSLWTDVHPIPEGNDAEWWEMWVRRDEVAWARFESFCATNGIRRKGNRLILPEHFIVVVQAARAQLEASIDLLDTLAEVRGARTCHIELTHLTAEEQHEWLELAVARIQGPSKDAPAVCLLDTGINRGHALLGQVMAERDNHSIFPDGDPSDADPGHGHGTPMAGLAAFGDIHALALGTEPWPQTHLLEGVKTFDASRQHEPENYGDITAQAVFTPESVAPRRARVYCLPITVNADHDGRPSSWSAAIDSLAFGAEEPDEPKRLLFVSAGNTLPFDDGYTYPSSNDDSPIQDPAQAWNAITVGALTHRSQILENDPESTLLSPVAPEGALSPHSRTSLCWDRHWPIKPEIVLEGGNLRHPDLRSETGVVREMR